MARTHVAQPKKSKKKVATAITAGVLSAALLIGGAFAWTDFSQNMINRFRGGVTADVLLHDDFQPWENKDVYVENTGEQPLIVRVLFKEYFQVGNEALVGANANNVKTWEIHTFENADENNDCGLVTHEYFEWEMTGNQKTYLHGTSEQGDADWSAEAIEDPANLGPNGQMFGETAEATTILSMEEWKNMTSVERATADACWILDTDGWAYWSKALQPAVYDHNGNVIQSGEATNLLLDNVNKIKCPDDNYYYAIDVQLQACNLTEHEELYTSHNGLPEASDDAIKYVIEDILDPDAWRGINIVETFPDDILAKYIADTYDNAPKDGYLNAEENKHVTRVVLDYETEITSLDGIEVLCYLESLWVSGNKISGTVDLSQNPVLHSIGLTDNNIDAVILGDKPLLRHLRVGSNNLTELNIPDCPLMTTLYVEDNYLTSLDATGMPLLIRITCQNNQIEYLDISGSPEIERITYVDVSNNGMKELVINGTLEALGIGGHTQQTTGNPDLVVTVVNP